jgi:hypothetical protein
MNLTSIIYISHLGDCFTVCILVSQSFPLCSYLRKALAQYQDWTLLQEQILWFINKNKQHDTELSFYHF